MLNKELALLIAEVMKSANLSDVDTNSFEFRIIVQKISYIIQRVGCDLGLKFGWYTLGPYSKHLQNIYNVVANIINNFKHNGSGIGAEISEYVKTCSEKTVMFLNEYRSYVGELNAKTLEVLASMLMLCIDIYPRPDNPVHELLKRKKNVSTDLVEKTWRFLVHKNICSF